MNRIGRIAADAIGLRALRSFAEIIRTGSATAAGRNLGMTQPAVSRIIAQLETSVGFELFYRDRGRLVPTKDALLLAEEVELALAGLERVNSLVRDIGVSATGELRVVAPPSFTEGLLPEMVAGFLARNPGVRFNLDSRSVDTTKAMIATRVADCGFMKLPIDERDLDAETLVTSGSVCVLLADHPLAARATLSPADLHHERLVLLGSGRQWRAQVDQAFAQFRLRPNVAIETHTHGSACALAASGVGIAIVNALLARSYIRAPLVVRPFAPPIIHEYAFVTSALSRPSRLTLAFRDEARRYFAAEAVAG
ncbi:LysR family transcriptional regulator [Sphingomonas sp. AR_OL41]|jgi:DNA-binding transcriptional LysR family regulator|uniref:LysR family transcriptional regulator n=1 Tax=Sphingomonas sp. AR_OL41 TaxID=3042729 RepID=UPI00247FFACB|nr:LysR family transcriptional regulator [Sphingomonas sp. AR_OL41]MDH7975484.1 LysR family transcriptional regulator [Sphingomonas sp. AR_OL41]